jgi:superfamily II DNA or RNA helicase
MAKCESSPKPKYIADLVRSWPDESTLIWCRYNDEQRALEQVLPEAASIDGDTPVEERQRIVDDFKAGRVRVLLSKPKILGFGLNLQVCTRQVFSGLQDSYEEYYQAVKRSNRIGSTRPLHVHIPVSDVERPMVENVLRKARRVEADTREQEAMFRDATESN